MIVRHCRNVINLPLFLILVLMNGCQIGGSGAFVQGDSPQDNNATYDKPPSTGDWVVMNLLDEPETLNPYTSTSASATNIYGGYIYETFLEYRREPPWDYIPLLIEEMPEVSDDHLIYIWRLRPDIRWHDGQQLTAFDSEFSLKAIMNPYVDDLPSKPYYADLDSVILLDDLTLKMYCAQPYFLQEDFLGGFSNMPKHIFDPEGLMDDLSYYQVKTGSAYGRIADFLEKSEPIAWVDLVPSVVLDALKKSLESPDSNLKWQDLLSVLQDWESLTPDERLQIVLNTEGTDPDWQRVNRLARETLKSTKGALSVLPVVVRINLLADRHDFPLRDSLATICRDIHERIKTFGEKFNFHPQGRAPTVGSGPYIFEKWDTGQEIILRRNENYWRGDGHAFLDKIVWRILTDYTASLVALKNGEIDFMENLQTIQYLTMTNRESFLEEFVKSTYLIPSYSYLGWRMGHPIFKDKLVRRAMTHMVRRKDLRDKLLFGFAEIVTGNFYRYGPDYDSTIVPYVYDPELAMKLLAEAGWSDIDEDGILEKDTLEFRFEMLIPSGSIFAEQLVSILREDLFMIGVEMDIRRLEWSVFINNYIRNHSFDACYLGWVFGMKGDPKQVWHSESATGRGSNHVEFMNEEADSLIDAARVEFDPEKRVKMYHQFQQILHEVQPYTFLFSAMRKPAYSKRFKGVKWYPFRPGYQFEKWFVPKDEQKF